MRMRSVSYRELETIGHIIDEYIANEHEQRHKREMELPLVLPTRLYRLLTTRWDKLNRSIEYQEQAKAIASNMYDTRRAAYRMEQE